MYKEEEICRGVWWGNLKERDNLEDPDVNGGILKMDLKETGLEGMKWINQAQDRTSGGHL